MDRVRRQRTLPDLERASAGEIDEALVHWDELDEPSIAVLADHPRHGARLERLRAAEASLTERRVDPGDCPSSDSLYDLGRGPGARPMAAERRH
jgi:hypothetical protein